MDPRWRRLVLARLCANEIADRVATRRDVTPAEMAEMAAASRREHATILDLVRTYPELQDGEDGPTMILSERIESAGDDFFGVKHAYVDVDAAAAWLLGAGGPRAARFARGRDQMRGAAARGAPHTPSAALAAVALRAADASRIWHVTGPVAPGAIIIPVTDALSGAAATPHGAGTLHEYGAFAADATGCVDDRLVIPAISCRQDGGFIAGRKVGEPIPPCIARTRGLVEWVAQ